jgi:RNA polymerase sigma-70 factor (ECF subfamily)
VPLALQKPADADTRDLTLAAEGDMVAFERLYRAHAPRIHALAVRFVGSELADDALQDIFIHAWDRLGQFRGESLFGTWLHRLGVNILIRQAEKVRRLGEYFGRSDVDRVHAPLSMPEEQLDINAALMRLSAEIRAVVVLHDVEGYGHDEIAQSMGISVSASKMRLHRGRLQLREWLLP